MEDQKCQHLFRECQRLTQERQQLLAEAAELQAWGWSLCREFKEINAVTYQSGLKIRRSFAVTLIKTGLISS